MDVDVCSSFAAAARTSGSCVPTTTPSSADAAAWYKRATATDLASVLQVPDPARTAGRFVLVYDDVCTTGGQLDAIAGCLRDRGGAARVEGVVLARAPWRGPHRADNSQGL